MRALLRKRAADAPSARAFAIANGFSPQYLSDVLSGRREPGGAILSALGLEKQVSYVKSTANGWRGAR